MSTHAMTCNLNLCMYMNFQSLLVARTKLIAMMTSIRQKNAKKLAISMNINNKCIIM